MCETGMKFHPEIQLWGKKTLFFITISKLIQTPAIFA